MVLLKVSGKETPGVGLAEDHHLVQTHPPDAPGQTLRTYNLSGAPGGGEDLLDAQVRDAPLKAIARPDLEVSEPVCGHRLLGKDFPELLCRSLGHWVFGHIEMEDFPSVKASRLEKSPTTASLEHNEGIPIGMSSLWTIGLQERRIKTSSPGSGSQGLPE
jgi:hypothetical protein